MCCGVAPSWPGQQRQYHNADAGIHVRRRRRVGPGAHRDSTVDGTLIVFIMIVIHTQCHISHDEQCHYYYWRWPLYTMTLSLQCHCH